MRSRTNPAEAAFQPNRERVRGGIDLQLASPGHPWSCSEPNGETGRWNIAVESQVGGEGKGCRVRQHPFFSSSALTRLERIRDSEGGEWMRTRMRVIATFSFLLMILPTSMALANHDGTSALVGGFEIDGNMAFDSLPTATRDWGNAAPLVVKDDY